MRRESQLGQGSSFSTAVLSDRSTNARRHRYRQAYKENGNWKIAQPKDEKLAGNWWEIFGDPQLNALEQQVNVSNQNLKAAAAQYQQALALLRYNRANYYPTLTTSPSATRIRDASNRPPKSSIFSGITYNDYVFPVQLSYQADVWGRIRRTVEQYRDQAQASAADLATVNLSMHADLALDYFEARTLDAEERLLNDTVAQYQQALELNQSLFNEGMASILTVQQAQTQLETTRAAAIDVGVLRAQYEHAAAVLVGKPPETFSLPPLPLTTPPPPIPAGLPSDLLERRPDIASGGADGRSGKCTNRNSNVSVLPTDQFGRNGRLRERFHHHFVPRSRRSLVFRAVRRGNHF